MSGLLADRCALVLGVANEFSLATGISRALHRHGAALGIGHAPGEKMAQRAAQATADLAPRFYVACDVRSDVDVAKACAEAAGHFGRLDAVVHSVAFAPHAALQAPLAAVSREDFLATVDVSVYSLLALAREAAPLMAPGGSLLTLTYIGARGVVPDYGVMGVAKAALESLVRYLAAELGPRGLRINAVSAAPVETLAMRGLRSGRRMLAEHRARAPLGRSITAGDVGDAAVYLCSPLASAVTGEVLYVDSGYHAMA